MPETFFVKIVSKKKIHPTFVPDFLTKTMMETENIKGKILAEAELLFMKYGFKSITMDDVARELGVSKKTLYQHFADKNDLVNQCVENHLSEINDFCNKIREEKDDAISILLGITEFVGTQIKSLTPSSMFDLKKYFKPAWDKLEANRKQFILESIRVNMELGQKKGVYKKDLDNELIARIYVHLVGFITDPENYDTPVMELRKLHLEVIKYHLRSVCTAKGQELLEEKLKQIKK